MQLVTAGPALALRRPRRVKVTGGLAFIRLVIVGE